ncbi:MAG: hypothetical protein N2C14_15830 [Planctomycetales bacterium]
MKPHLPCDWFSLMETKEDYPGTTVLLGDDDSLDDVPESHQSLISDETRAVFADPAAYFSDVRDRCEFPKMKQWLARSVEQDEWQLELCLGETPDGIVSSVQFIGPVEDVCPAGMELPDPEADLTSLPPALRDLHLLVDGVYWQSFGCAGGVDPASWHRSLKEAQVGTPSEEFARSTYVWGGSYCGDSLIHALDDRGGWLSHETLKVHWIGTIAETLDWLFGEMLAGREPNYDYSWL